MIHVRRAGTLDAGVLSNLLNEIIAKGGTTAKTTPVSRATLTEWVERYDGKSAWHLAEDGDGLPLGFQWIEPHVNLTADAVDIATYARLGHSGLGVGSALFEATRKAAISLGYRWINATIRADNAGGLAYYQSRGFETYDRIERAKLDDGTIVSKIKKRFDL